MRVSSLCYVVVRLDDKEPDPDAPESIDDFSDEYRLRWADLNHWLAHAGIVPAALPPPGWWSVEALYAFKVKDVPRVLTHLRELGAPANECVAFDQNQQTS